MAATPLLPWRALAQAGVSAQPSHGVHASLLTAQQRALTWFSGDTTPHTVALTIRPAEGMPGQERAFAAISTATPTYGIPLFTHRVVLDGVAPGQALRYRIARDGVWVQEGELPAFPSGKLRFCHFADHAQSMASQAVVAGVLGRRPDLAIIAGDLAYANGDQALWDSYFAMLEPLAAAIPVLSCPGNHERHDGSGQGYLSRITQPGRGAWYALDLERVHFFFGTAGCLVDGPASVWALVEEVLAMEQDLATAAARRAKGEIDFIVVVQHYPIWTDEDGRDPADFTLVALEEGMLLRYGVDLLLVGHDHIYERSLPMGRGRPRDGGYVQVTQGGGGQSLYDVIPNPASWSALAMARWGFSAYEVTGMRIRVTSHVVDDHANQLLPAGQLQELDSFDVVARDATARRHFARPPRPREELLEGFAQIVAHTIDRNHLA
jgi:hypothetical protein